MSRLFLCAEEVISSWCPQAPEQARLSLLLARVRVPEQAPVLQPGQARVRGQEQARVFRRRRSDRVPVQRQSLKSDSFVFL